MLVATTCVLYQFWLILVFHTPGHAQLSTTTTLPYTASKCCVQNDTGALNRTRIPGHLSVVAALTTSGCIIPSEQTLRGLYEDERKSLGSTSNPTMLLVLFFDSIRHFAYQCRRQRKLSMQNVRTANCWSFWTQESLHIIVLDVATRFGGPFIFYTPSP